MKKTMIVAALMALVATGANAKKAADSAEVAKNKPVFTVVKQNPITSIKDQNRSGTCWAYSTLSYFESEILKKTGKTYDLSEMFVANKTYMDRATVAVRMHGDVSFSEVVAPTMYSMLCSTMVLYLSLPCLHQVH